MRISRYNVDTKEIETLYKSDEVVYDFYILNEHTFITRSKKISENWFFCDTQDNTKISVSEKLGTEGKIISIYENGFIYAVKSSDNIDVSRRKKKFLFYENGAVVREFEAVVSSGSDEIYFGYGANLFFYNQEKTQLELINEKLEKSIPVVESDIFTPFVFTRESLQVSNGKLYLSYRVNQKEENGGNQIIYIDLYSQTISNPIYLQGPINSSVNEKGILINAVRVGDSQEWIWEMPLLQYDFLGEITSVYPQNGAQINYEKLIVHNSKLYMVARSDVDENITLRIVEPIPISEVDEKTLAYISKLQVKQ